ncbi:S-layer homology domain-containing protein [Propioniciclava soli]|uniref:S-layer homology domain-containing protein n=1 Tax=Propioniciclava soli TaxID=2775081 RepID=A0ABZ3C2W1_9ACTN
MARPLRWLVTLVLAWALVFGLGPAARAEVGDPAVAPATPTPTVTATPEAPPAATPERSPDPTPEPTPLLRPEPSADPPPTPVPPAEPAPDPAPEVAPEPAPENAANPAGPVAESPDAGAPNALPETDACIAMPLAAWAAPLPVAAVRTGLPECFTFTTRTTGPHQVRYGRPGAGMPTELSVYDPAGTLVRRFDSWNRGAVAPLTAAVTYRLIVGGGAVAPDPAYTVGVFDLLGTACRSISTAWDAPDETITSTARGQLDCRQLTAAGPDTLWLSATGHPVDALVYDAFGAQQCYASITGFACRLAAAGRHVVILQPASDDHATSTISVRSLSDDRGCVTAPLGSWRSPLPAATTRTRLAECRLVTTTSTGPYVMRLQPGARRLQTYVFDTARTLVGEHDTSDLGPDAYAVLRLQGGTTHTVVTVGPVDATPQTYQIGLLDIMGTPGCESGLGRWDAPARPFVAATGAEVDCLQPTAERAGPLLVSLGALGFVALGFGPDGGQICEVTTNEPMTCGAADLGPRRLLLMRGTPAAGETTVWIGDLTAPTGCAPLGTAAWRTPLPTSAVRTGPPECFVYTPTASGAQALRIHRTTGAARLSVTVHDSRGARVAAFATDGVDEPSAVVGLAVNAPHLVVVTSPAAAADTTYRVGVVPVMESTGCPVLDSDRWDTAPWTAALDPGDLWDCRELTSPAGSTLWWSHLDLTGSPVFTVVDAVGSQVCRTRTRFSVGSFRTGACRLTGVAPFRVLAQSANEQQARGTTSWASMASRQACADASRTMSFAEPAASFPAPATAGVRCLTLGLSTGDTALFSLTGADVAALAGYIVDAAGEEQCSTAANASVCRLRGRAPFRAVVTASRPGAVGSWQVAVRRINAPVGCERLDSLVTGASWATRLDAVDAARCVRFVAGAGDQLDATASNPDAPATLPYGIFQADGTDACKPRTDRTDPNCAVRAGGDLTAVLWARSTVPLGRVTFGLACWNPVCGPAAFSLARVTPAVVGAGATTSVEVSGRVLLPGTTVSLVRGGTTVPGTVTSWSADARSATVRFDLASAALGSYDVVAHSATEGTARLLAGLTVQAPEQPIVNARLLTRGAFRWGRSTRFTVEVTNHGNVDAGGVLLMITGLPAASNVSPRFSLVDPKLPATGRSDWSQERDTFVRDGVRGIPLYLSSLPAGSTRSYEFNLEVPQPAPFTLNVSAGRCLVTEPPGGPGAGVAESGRSAGSAQPDAWGWFGAGGCGDALLDLFKQIVMDAVPGGACAGLAADAAAAIARNVANEAPPFSAASASDLFWSGLGSVACVSSVIPGGQGLAAVLGALGEANTVFTALEKCWPEQDSATMVPVASFDPNELVGPRGGGTAHALTPGGRHRFGIYFENLATATAPAQEVRITHHIDPAHYDLGDVRFSDVQFGATHWTPVSPSGELDERLTIPDALVVDVDATVDAAAGTITWTLITVDPLTGELPDDPLRGFLPPNTDGTRGQGVVWFDVPLRDVASGTATSSISDIVFDLNPAIRTNTWSNLIDGVAPQAGLAPLPPSSPNPTFAVSWQASDAHAGVRQVELFVAVDGGAPTPWATVTDATGSRPFTGAPGHAYGFYAIATDAAGLRSATPTAPQATTRVGSGTTAVTAVPPVFAERCGTGSDTVTIPATPGVGYLIGGQTAAAGVHPARGQVIVEARALPGYVLTGTTRWAGSFAAGSVFDDVPVGTEHLESICWMYVRGLTTGYGTPPRLTYQPVSPVNRDAMAAFLYRYAGSPAYTPPAISPFADVPTTAQFYKEIAWLAEQGITTGWETGGRRYYRPLTPVNRDAMAAFLYRFAGSPVWTPPAASPFADLTPSTAFYSEITWLAHHGITTGWVDGPRRQFRPVNPVNRDAMAAFLQRYDAAELR